MTTLADLTPEERAQCIGMWCGYNRYTEGGEPSDFVIMVEDVNEAGRVPCINPGAPSPTVWAPAPWMLTLRPDLPRAWTPHGKPAAGEWEYAVQYKTRDGWKYSRPSWENRWQDSEAVQEVRAYRDHPGEETRLVRRLVTQPEVMEE